MLRNVTQGSASVVDSSGNVIGSVCKSEYRRGWFAYDKDGKRISDDPNHNRRTAVAEVLRAAGQGTMRTGAVVRH